MNKIFIVEDDVYVSRMYERAFRLGGFEVELVDNGIKALETLKSLTELPSVIVLDAMVPGMNGLEMLRAIRKEKRLAQVPVAILTNSFSRESSEQFLGMGASLYMVKIDNTSKEVVDKITKLINESSHA